MAGLAGKLGAVYQEYAATDKSKLIADFQDDETWTSGAGTQADDAVNFRLGTESVKITENDGTGGLLYSWSDGSLSDSNYVNPSTTTEYILTVFNNGCSDTDTVIVNVNELPDLVASTTDNLILENTTAQLTVSGAGMGAIYDWNPPIGLNDPTIQNPIVSATEGVTYFVTGTDLNGCSDTASVRIDVASTIVFPDGITPNGDGLNEFWVIQLIDEFPDANVKIFNRWGQKVFESKRYVDQWDGTNNGKKLPVGTYYYLIDLGPNQEKFTGPITLMR